MKAEEVKRPKVAVVVPTRNSDATLRECLQSIRNQTTECKLIVVDNFSSDLTLHIARELADLVLQIGPERSAQRNAGAKNSIEDVLGFIDSDMILNEHVVEEALFAIIGGASTVVVPEVTIGEGYWARVSAYERSFYLDVESVEAPRFFTRRCFEEVGGFDETMTGAEDWDLGIRTIRAGPRARTNAVITHNEGHVKYFSLCRKKGYYATGVGIFFRKYGAQGLKDAASRPWLRSPRALLRPLGIGLILLKFGQLCAMSFSLGRSAFAHKRHRRTSKL